MIDVDFVHLRMRCFPLIIRISCYVFASNSMLRCKQAHNLAWLLFVFTTVKLPYHQPEDIKQCTLLTLLLFSGRSEESSFGPHVTRRRRGGRQHGFERDIQEAIALARSGALAMMGDHSSAAPNVACTEGTHIAHCIVSLPVCIKHDAQHVGYSHDGIYTTAYCYVLPYTQPSHHRSKSCWNTLSARNHVIAL